jgi:hypothetical protein
MSVLRQVLRLATGVIASTSAASLSHRRPPATPARLFDFRLKLRVLCFPACAVCGQARFYLAFLAAPPFTAEHMAVLAEMTA